MKRFCFLLFWAGSISVLAQPNIIRIEYFIDADPGRGNGTSIITASQSINILENIATASLSEGFHVFSVRAEDQNGVWGLPESKPFFVSQSSSVSQNDIVAMEYFIDADPGRGSGVDIPITPAINLDILENVPTALLTTGFHLLTIRARDQFGVWGLFESKPFYVTLSTTTIQNNIVAMEYFIDADPGSGLGVSVPITPAINLNILENIPTSSLSEGFHLLTVRAQDVNGVWGLSESKPFYVDLSTTTIQNDIVAMEYFIDADPGRGSGVAIPITPAINLDILENVPTTLLSEGFHLITVRAQDVNGIWGLSESKPFYVTLSSTSIQNNIVAMEYYFDTDPGHGNGIPIPVTPAVNINVLENIPMGSLANGMHQIFIRAEDVNNVWGQVESKSFFVDESRLIINYEYAIDVDPGISLAIQQPIVPPQVSIDEPLLIDTNPLSIGPHNLIIRIEDSHLFWSKTSIVPFTVCTGATANFSSVAVECLGSPTTFTDLSIDVLIGDTYSWDFDGDAVEDDNTVGSASFTFPTAGTFVATLTIDRAGCPSFMSMNVDVVAPPTSIAGADVALCEGGVANLTGIIGGSATSSVWTTTGAGSFDDVNSLTAIYTPDVSEIGAGPITLTLTTDDPVGNCVAVSSSLNLTVDPLATASAGSDLTICEGTVINLSGVIGGSAISLNWSSSGTGLFNDPTSLTAIYTPDISEIGTGPTVLTLTTNDPIGACVAAVSSINLTVDPRATSNAGSDITICEGNTLSLTGSIGGSALSSLWTSTGAGLFDDATSLTANYTPDISEVGGVPSIITLTTNDPVGICPAAVSSFNLTTAAQPTAIAGSNLSTCEGSTINLSGVIGGAASSSTWTTTGDGSFNNATLLNAVYSPGANDLTNGTVDLILTTDDPDGAGPCIAASSQLTLSINQQATTDAGLDVSICPAASVNLIGIIGGSAINPIWTTNGTGTFDNSSSLTAIYTPSPADEANGTVTITLIAAATGPCPAVSNDLIITILQPITAAAIPANANIQQVSTIDVITPATLNTGDILTLTILQQGTKGVATIQPNNTIDYTPNSGTVGTDLIDYQICNQCGLCSSNTITITILNVPPVFAPISTPPTVPAGGILDIDLIPFISDLNDNIDLSSLSITTPPISQASATININFHLIVDYATTPFAGSDNLTIEVCDLLAACDQVNLFILVDGAIVVRNGISPNGDGLNDFWIIHNIQFLEPQNRVSLFNRWGDMVFEMENYNNTTQRFEGIGNNGKKLLSGTYYYKIEFTVGKKILTGYLTIR